MHPNGSHDLRLRLKIVLEENFYNCKSVCLLKDNLNQSHIFTCIFCVYQFGADLLL